MINAIVTMKQRNPGWGCPRIAVQISLAFGVTLDKDLVRRVLARDVRPMSHGHGPSWLAFLAPDIMQAIARGKVPPALSLDRLKKGFPLDWQAQRASLGFSG